MEWRSVNLLLLLSCLIPSSLAAGRLSRPCRDLLSCAIRNKCVKVKWLESRLAKQAINPQMYDALTEGIDYGCIFNTGCNEECNRCPLCMSSKLQLTDVLSGSERSANSECYELVNCASACVAAAGTEVQKIYGCLLHGCAYHCFNGSCPKCSSFTTRIFNQACVSGNFRSVVLGFQGQCHEMYRQIVYQKFRTQFDGIGRLPSIGEH